MAIAVADLPTVFSRRANIVLRRTEFLTRAGFINRSWDMDVRMNRKAVIPVQPESVTVSDVSRGGAYPTPEGTDVNNIDLVVDQQKMAANEVLSLDQLESQLDVIGRQLDIEAYQVGLAVQTDMFTFMRSGVKAANVQAKTTTAAEYLTGSDKIEDETVYTAVGKRIDGLIYNAIGQDWVGRDAAQTTMPLVLCHPWVFLAYLEHLRKRNVVPEVSELRAFTLANVAGEGMQMMSMYHNGVRVIGTSVAKQYNDADSDPVYPAILYLPMSYVTMGMRPVRTQMVEPQYNTKDAWIMRTIVNYGRLVMNSGHAYSTLIRAGA